MKGAWIELRPPQKKIIWNY